MADDPVGVGLAGAEPGDDRFDGDDGGELGGPPPPGLRPDPAPELGEGAVGHGGAELVHLVAELGFPGRVLEQESKAVGVLGSDVDQGGEGVVAEVAGAAGLREAGADAVEDLAVEVGFGVEVPVEDDPADPGFGGDIAEAGGVEPGAGEGGGGGVEDLAAPVVAPQP